MGLPLEGPDITPGGRLYIGQKPLLDLVLVVRDVLFLKRQLHLLPVFTQANKQQVQIVLFITLGYNTWGGTAGIRTTRSGTKGTTDG
jgi:hypothetical protein